MPSTPLWRRVGQSVAVCIVILCALVAYQWHTADAARPVPRPPAVPARVTKAEAPIEPRELLTTFQGPVRWQNGSEEWVVLQVRAIRPTSETVAFDYVLGPELGQGEADLTRRTIRFGKFAGEIRRATPRGLLLTSVRLNGPPFWSLESPR